MPAVIITGASGGLGKAIARRFAAGGWTLILPLRREMGGLAEELGEVLEGAAGRGGAVGRDDAAGRGGAVERDDAAGRGGAVERDDAAAPGALHFFQADLSRPEDIENFFDEMRRRGIQADALINNAALQNLQPLTELDAAQWDRMMAVNVRAVHLLTRLFAGLEGAQGGADGNSGGRGEGAAGNAGVRGERAGGAPGKCCGSAGRSIVNIASIEARRPAVNHSHYAASKAALVQYTRAAALELGPRNIRVNCVSPGLISRPALETDWPDGVERYRKAAALGRLVEASDVAGAVWFLCSPAAGGITGVNLPVDCGAGASPGY